MKKHLKEKYQIRRHGLGTVIERVKQQVHAKAVKIKRYSNWIEQYQ